MLRACCQSNDELDEEVDIDEGEEGDAGEVEVEGAEPAARCGDDGAGGSAGGGGEGVLIGGLLRALGWMGGQAGEPMAGWGG